MQIRDYLNEVLAVIAESPFVEAQKLSFEERPPDAVYITGSLTFLNDNALDPKARHFSTYPHHKHTSKELLPAGRPELRELLKEISCLTGG